MNYEHFPSKHKTQPLDLQVWNVYGKELVGKHKNPSQNK
jgi:hypothetical protein